MSSTTLLARLTFRDLVSDPGRADYGSSMTAGALASRFSHSWPTTTRPLGVLVKAGLITVRPDGRERHYVLNRERLTSALELWLPSVGIK